MFPMFPWVQILFIIKILNKWIIHDILDACFSFLAYNTAKIKFGIGMVGKFHFK